MVRRYAHLAPNHLTEHGCKIDALLAPTGLNNNKQAIVIYEYL